MSKQNVETVRSVLEPFEGIDVAAVDWGSEAIRVILESALTPDAELMTLKSGLASGVDDHYRGRDGFVRYFQDWFGPFSEYHIEWLDYVEAGDCVLVPSRQWGVGVASGAPAKLELTYLCELRDGQIARLEQYDTLEEAREVAGRRD